MQTRDISNMKRQQKEIKRNINKEGKLTGGVVLGKYHLFLS